MEFSEEQLQKMSPSEIADQQKKNCIFCHIVSGRVASKKVFEDDKVLAILDINPANPGHVLLLPKEHYAIMPLVPEDLIAHMFMVAKHLSQAQLKALKAQGTTILAANGMVAGQRAPHFMIHVIPRKEGDGVGFEFAHKPLSQDDHAKLLSAIRKRAGALLGQEPKEPVDLSSNPAKIKAETVQAEFEEDGAEAVDLPEADDTSQPGETDEQAATEETEDEAGQEQSQPYKKVPAKKAKSKKSAESKPKKSHSKKQSAGEPEQKKPESPKQNKTEAPAADPNLDLISRLF